ncbi:hypothetical protein SARC_00995 [Sphaeroforma arctica JP610]|uniref:Uncharacterized protein n=1 Tax=Sphaeroforma arctica JP610 TaxID=667725 RepID=A0A0L0GD64_9EUKA|nr:hypothetical protein SARC_00995 [Sphaeroforma arctica JP610]KNC86849.1 hypothetical protein SARC_00995 [Sphaeroforma arctica JP610]|eukprot:XP_014160751.1 hypothetical protein SARC_00995 [Sphaeroforma arctica JP610]
MSFPFLHSHAPANDTADSAAKDGTVAEMESMPTQEALVKQLEEADRLLKVQIEERNRIEALIKNAQNTDPASKDLIVS